MKKRLAYLLLAAGFFCLATQAKAQDYSNIRIVRLSFVEGNVEYQRPGQGWRDARLNLPIEQGFAIRTSDGYAEVEFEDSLTLRLGVNATVEFTELALQNGGRVTKLTVPQGTAIVSAKLKHEDTLSVETPNLNLTLPRDGRFRMDISSSDSWVSVFRGKVEVNSGAGANSLLTSGRTLHWTAAGSGSPEIAGNPPQDDFDKWVSHREEALNEAQSETSAVLGPNSYTTGYADLYNYGLWTDIPGYGTGWMPYGLGAGWMPFMDGQWQFMGGLGWNWISGEPWGWLPYHFGSWVNAPGIGWAWVPLGSNSWQPATANWVQVNNQIGWIPAAPPTPSKPTKTQLAALPSTVILAGENKSGGISAGTRMSLAQAGKEFAPASAPAPSSFAAPARESTQGKSLASSPVAAKSFAPTAPTSMRAPSVSTSASAGARLSAAPQAVMAPHALPAPAIARGASTAGFGGRSAAHSAGNSGFTSFNPAASISASPSATVTNSGSHSSGSASTSGSHH